MAGRSQVQLHRPKCTLSKGRRFATSPKGILGSPQQVQRPVNRPDGVRQAETCGSIWQTERNEQDISGAQRHNPDP